MMDKPEHGVDYHEDGHDVRPLLFALMLAAIVVPVGLVFYLLAVLHGRA